MTEITKYDPDNIFAKILRGDAPCVKVYENNKTLAFMDIFPQAEGHTLVIPKHTQAINILDVRTADLHDLIDTTQTVAKAVDQALSPRGLRIMQFNGAEAGQTVYHIHFHIIPIYAGGALSAHAGGEAADRTKLEALAERIRAQISL